MLIRAWLDTRVAQASGRLVIAAGRRAVRGARNREEKTPRLFAALAHGTSAVLGQVAVDAKSSEIPAVRELLEAFTEAASNCMSGCAVSLAAGAAAVTSPLRGLPRRRAGRPAQPRSWRVTW